MALLSISTLVRLALKLVCRGTCEGTSNTTGESFDFLLFGCPFRRFLTEFVVGWIESMTLLCQEKSFISFIKYK